MLQNGHSEKAKDILAEVAELRQTRVGSWGAQADKLTNEALAHAVLALNDTLSQLLPTVDNLPPKRLN